MIEQFVYYSKPKKVCMFVYNNFLNDSRVKKEAQTLIKAGNQVTVLALLDACTKPFENKDSIRIIRLPINPWHLRLLGWIKNFSISGALRNFSSQVFKNQKKHFSLVSGRVSADRKNKMTDFLFLIRCLPEKVFNKNTLKATFYLFLTIIAIEFLFSNRSYEWITHNKILIYGILWILLICRKYVLYIIKSSPRYSANTIKRLLNGIAKYSVNTLKSLLMPFHRQFCFLSFYKNAFRFTSGDNFDVYHAHDLNTLPVAFFIAKRHKAKLVYDSHELYVERNKLKPSSKIWKLILSQVERFLVQKADAVFTVNETIAEEMARRYNILRPDVVMNTPSRRKNSEQNPIQNGGLRSELPIPSDYWLVLYVGAITFNRGLEQLIQSLEFLPNCFLACMGYGTEPFKNRLLEIVEKVNVYDRFSFFGPVPSDQVIHYASGADIGVAPIANACMSYYYCSPNKLFEYMNAGLPVAASDFPELEKVVLGHQIGLTFDPSNPRDIARSIQQILGDPLGREKMAKNAVEASKFYNWENESKKLLRIYAKL